VEKIAGIRAFVGAGRLGAQAKLIQESDDPAPEIYASGRQFDLKAILERIRRSDSKLTILHGPSGVGKSSLVNAGLIPTLQKKPIGYRMALPVVMRQYRDWAIALVELLEGERSPNPPTANPAADPDEAATLRTFLATLRQCESRNQFPVLIFDQFEEFFFANPTPRQRRQFFEFLSDCLSIPCIYVILSLREDYIHYLLEASRTVQRHETPDNLLSRHIFSNILGKDILYAIGNFSPAQAKAIVDDLTGRSRSYLEPDLVDALVHELAGELNEVRPIELQIVGSQLETEQVRSLAQYRELGDEPKEELVSRYLQEVVDDCGEEYAQLAELVLYLLTDERGTRPLKTRSELKRELEVLLSALSIPPLAPGSAAGEGQEQPEDSLGYVLRILCGSGIVVYLPEDPEDRYQLVHDYIAETVQAKRSPQFDQMYVEERQKREKAEILQQQTAAELADAQKINRKAQRRLVVGTGVLAASLVAALIAVPTAIIAGNQADRAAQQANQATQREQAATEQFNEAQTQLEQAQAEKTEADAAVVAAEEAVVAAEERVNQAQADLDELTAQNNASEAAIEAAEERLAEAQRQFEVAQQAEAAAQTALTETRELQGRAEAEREAAQAERDAAQAETQFAREGTRLERAGVAAIRRFESQQTEGLLAALRAGHDLNALNQQKQIQAVGNYPAASPMLALQTSLDIIRETRLEGHQGIVWQVAFSPNGDRIATRGSDGTARLWDTNGTELVKFEGHQGSVSQVTFSPNGDRIATRGDDGTTRIWAVPPIVDSDADTPVQGQQIAQYEGILGAFNHDWSRVFIIQPGNNLIRDPIGEVVTLWPVDDLEGLIARACDRLHIFLLQSPTVTDSDRALCNLPPKSSDSPASPSDEQASRPFERVTSVVRRWLGVG